MQPNESSSSSPIPVKETHHKTKTEFKRDSLTRYNAFNNLLIYYLSHHMNIYALRYYKHASKIVRFLMISHIEWKGKEIYRYDLSHKTLTYTDLTTNNQITLTNISNLVTDIQRRQVNILISIAQQIGMTVQFTRSDLKKTSIEKSNIQLLAFFDEEEQHHIITKDNVEEYYEDIRVELDDQMRDVDKVQRVFLVQNPVNVFPFHSSLPSIDKTISIQQKKRRKRRRKNEEIYNFYESATNRASSMNDEMKQEDNDESDEKDCSQ